MNKQELSEMVELLKKEENAELRKEFASLFVTTIEHDFQLKDKIIEMVNRGLGEKLRHM